MTNFTIDALRPDGALYGSFAVEERAKARALIERIYVEANEAAFAAYETEYKRALGFYEPRREQNQNDFRAYCAEIARGAGLAAGNSVGFEKLESATKCGFDAAVLHASALQAGVWSWVVGM